LIDEQLLPALDRCRVRLRGERLLLSTNLHNGDRQEEERKGRKGRKAGLPFGFFAGFAGFALIVSPRKR